MRSRHLITAGLAAVAHLVGAGVTTASAQAAPPAPTVSFTHAPGTVQLPAFGKSGTFSVSVAVANPRVDPAIMKPDPYNIEKATISQNFGSSTSQPVLTYGDSAERPLNATFTVYGGVNYGTLNGRQTLTVVVVDGINGAEFSVSRPITLISHDGKITAIAGVGSYKSGKRYTVQATSTYGSVGATATVYYAKKGSKAFHKIATAKIHAGFGIGAGPASAFRFVTTKLKSGGHVYFVIMGPYTAKTTSKKYTFTVKNRVGKFK
jgi:hypothetical protein